MWDSEGERETEREREGGRQRETDRERERQTDRERKREAAPFGPIYRCTSPIRNCSPPLDPPRTLGIGLQ
jgi:hypothetical protein